MIGTAISELREQASIIPKLVAGLSALLICVAIGFVVPPARAESSSPEDLLERAKVLVAESGMERTDLLNRAAALLRQIVILHPGSELAVRILLGEEKVNGLTLSDIEAMVDDAATATAVSSEKLSAAEIDAVEASLTKYFTFNGAASKEVKVTVGLRLNEDRQIRDRPQLLRGEGGDPVSQKALFDAARRAILMGHAAGVFESLPAEKFVSWGELNLIFSNRAGPEIASQSTLGSVQRATADAGSPSVIRDGGETFGIEEILAALDSPGLPEFSHRKLAPADLRGPDPTAQLQEQLQECYRKPAKRTYIGEPLLPAGMLSIAVEWQSGGDIFATAQSGEGEGAHHARRVLFREARDAIERCWPVQFRNLRVSSLAFELKAEPDKIEVVRLKIEEEPAATEESVPRPVAEVAAVIPPEQSEASLNLDRRKRREIQRRLTLAGFNTNGVDGVFGPATRAAIKAWQSEHSLPVSGFLNADQLTALASETEVGSSRVDLQACKLEYSIVSPK